MKILAALLLLAAPALAQTPLHMPVASGCISSPFGPRRAIGPHAPAAFHTGIDLPAPAGGVVTAVAAGTVSGIHRRGPGGLEVVVQHDGFTAIYAHLGRVTPALAEGATHLAPGTPIGVIGRTGITYGTHLFFEILRDNMPIDPAPMLAAKPCGK